MNIDQGGPTRRQRNAIDSPYARPRTAMPISRLEDADNFNATGKNGARIQEFVFTINGEPPYLKECMDWFRDNHGNPTWFIVGYEFGNNTQRLHLQGRFIVIILINNKGAMVLGKRIAFTTLKKWFPFRSAHIEPMRGTPKDSQAYCSKGDNYIEFGTCPDKKKPGSSLQEAITAIRNGSTLPALAQSGQEGAHAVTVHGRGLIMLKSNLISPRDPTKPPKVIWVCGETGVGKTRCAIEFGSKLSSGYWVSSDPDLKWFDTYFGQGLAIFDDFRAKGVKFNWLLRLLDRYPLQVPIKGGFTEWNPSFIIITTPKCPEDTFSTRFSHKPEDIGQLRRRISKVFEFPKRDPVTGSRPVYNKYNHYLVKQLGKAKALAVPKPICDPPKQSSVVSSEPRGNAGGHLPFGPYQGPSTTTGNGGSSGGEVNRGEDGGGGEGSDSELSLESFLRSNHATDDDIQPFLEDVS